MRCRSDRANDGRSFISLLLSLSSLLSYDDGTMFFGELAGGLTVKEITRKFFGDLAGGLTVKEITINPNEQRRD